MYQSNKYLLNQPHLSEHLGTICPDLGIWVKYLTTCRSADIIVMKCVHLEHPPLHVYLAIGHESKAMCTVYGKL